MKRAFVAATAIAGTSLLVYAIRSAGVSRIEEAFLRVGWRFVAILFLSGAREAMRTAAWTRSVEGPLRLPFRDAFRARLAGEALNSLLPMGMLVGEPTKAEHVGHRLSFGTAFKALAVEFTFYGASLVLLFGAAFVAFWPFPALVSVAAAAAILPLVLNANWRTGILERTARSRKAAASVVTRAFEKLRRLCEPVLTFAIRHPHRAWRIAALECGYQLLAVGEVYLTLALISPGHAAWTSALVLETVNRAVTMMFKIVPMRAGVDEAGAALFASHLDLGSATGITLALVRKVRLLVWSAVGLVFLVARSVRQPVASATPAIFPVRP